MGKREKEEIERLPEKYRPLSSWAFFGYQCLFSIPLVGFICVIIFSLSSDNINRRNLARSNICALIIVIILIVVIAVVGGAVVLAVLY